MDKKEKYINFIVDDLIKKTEINHIRGDIRYPSSTSLYLLPPPSSLSSLSNYPLFLYIIERYGAHSEEMGIIWDLYKQRIKELIDNE